MIIIIFYHHLANKIIQYKVRINQVWTLDLKIHQIINKNINRYNKNIKTWIKNINN